VVQVTLHRDGADESQTGAIMAQKTILAVAIGNPANSTVIRDDNVNTLAGKRAYIKGLIDRLKSFGHLIGDANYYVID
jgi:hypothetical protein